jgi:nicotinamidase-related amidase
MHEGERSEVVLLLIDLINPFDYPGAEEVLANTRRILPEVRTLKSQFAARNFATVYVNDNFRRWRSSFAETVEHCLTGDGRDVVEGLRPGKNDYFVLKPHRSGFYATPLDLLLEQLGARILVFAGIATDMCVLATASDAQIRGFQTIVATDGTAAMNRERHERALEVMEESLGTRLSTVRQVLDAAEMTRTPGDAQSM